MREIKFRSWSKKAKKIGIPWTIPFLIKTTLEDPVGASKAGDIKESFEIMQFTGLKDKNGKEIYEGDIVKIYNYKQTWKRGEPEIDWRVFEIKWNRYLWSFNNSVISKPLADYDTADLMPYDIEIIGNIYENPELLSLSK